MQTNTKTSSGLAITALVLGIVAFCLGWTGIFGLILAILALVFGILALVKKQNKAMGIVGVVLASVALITAFFVTVLGVALIGGAAQVANDVHKEQQAVDNAKKDFAKGETATFDKLTVKVTKVTPKWQAKDGFSTPKSGYEYVFVSINVKNSSKETVSVNPYDFKMNNNGVVADHEIAVTPTSFDAVDLKPGASLDGDLVFQVKKGATGLKLEYTTYNDKALKNVTYTLGV